MLLTTTETRPGMRPRANASNQTLKRRSLVRGEHSKVHSLSGLSENCATAIEPIGGAEFRRRDLYAPKYLDVVEDRGARTA